MTEYMKKQKNITVWFAVVVILISGIVASTNLQAFAAKADLGSDTLKAKTVYLTLGKAETIDLNNDVTDILIGNPGVVEAGALKADRIYVVGTALGDTNILLFGDNGQTIDKINVHVRVDEETLQDTIQSFFPEEDIRVKAVNDDLIIAGKVSSAAIANSARDIAVRFLGEEESLVNLMTIQEEQQVTIKVKVVEISREILNEISSDIELDTDGVLGNGAFTSGLLTNTSDTSTDIFLGGASAAASQLSSTSGLSEMALTFDPGGTGPISLLLDALEQDSLAKILAEPNLTAKSGENARFIAGGQVPVVSNVNANGLVTFTYQPFGVVLSFRPVVLSKNQISLNISTEVSEVSTALGTVVGDIPFPSFEVRRAETVVELPSGGSLMIAGLIESETISNMSGLPGVEETPIIGELVKSDSFSRDETELIIMISAYLSEPFADKENVELVDARKNIDQTFDALSRAFAANITRNFGDRAPESVHNEYKLGYIIDNR